MANPNDNQQSLLNTKDYLDSYSCNACNDIDTDQMVQCDNCDGWYHYNCAGEGITDDIAEIPWCCSGCVEESMFQTLTPQSKVRSTTKHVTDIRHSSQRSESSRNSTTKLALDYLEELRKLEQQQMEKSFEIQRKYLEEKFELLNTKSMSAKSSRCEEEVEDKTMTVEEWINKHSKTSPKVQISPVQLKDAVAMAMHTQGSMKSTVKATDRFSKMRVNMQPRVLSRINEQTCPNLPQQSVNVKKDDQNTPVHQSNRLSTQREMLIVPSMQFDKTKYPIKTQFLNSQSDVQTTTISGIWSTIPGDPFYAYGRYVPTTSDKSEITRKIDMPVSYQSSSTPTPIVSTFPVMTTMIQSSSTPTPIVSTFPVMTTMIQSSSASTPIVSTSPVMTTRIQPPGVTVTSRQILDSSQIAARHILPRDLPKFYGSPIEWPMFISAYESSTSTGGYSNAENLIRLQRCLQGKALDAVRSILLVPDNVPSVIETLRMMYGRPDLIIHTLINQMRQATPPKMEKLETIIDYALLVRNLCATIRVCNMVTHLNNPFLLQEVVDKLPSSMKLDWSKHKRTVPDINLETLANWLYEVAQSASEVIIPNVSSSSNTLASSLTPNTKKKSDFKSNNKCFILAQADKDPTSSETSKCKICLLSCSKVENCRKFKEFTIEQRWNAVKQQGLCSTCLKSHRRFQCKDKKKCQKPGCDFWHHPLLHNDNKKVESQVEPPKTVAHLHTLKFQPIIYRIVPVILHGSEMSFMTFAYLDEGSGLTLMENHIATNLGIEGKDDSLCLRWTSKVQRSEPYSRKIRLHISDIDDSKRYEMVNVRTVRSLDLPQQTVSSEMMKQYSHLEGIPIRPYTDAVSRILIGLENINLIVSLETIEGQWKEPVATRTRLGWVLQGGQNFSKKTFIPCMPTSEHQVDQDLHLQVKEYFSIESLGVKVPEKTLESKLVARARNILEITTKLDKIPCESGLLWKEDKVEFPDSYPMARKRLENLEKRMKKEPKLADNLNSQLIEYENKGYIRKLSQEEVESGHKDSCYLPIFPVLDPKKPAKVRIVWDAAAEVKGVSLNSNLLTGPDFLVPLPEILHRFRERSIAICGDIKEMFHQISVREEDQNSQRFLWRNGDQSREPDVFVMKRMTFGATCSPCIAQFVKNTNAKRYEDQFPRAVTAIINNHYVDDMLECTDTVEEAVTLVNDVKFIHKQVGFEIRKFISNSPEVVQALGEKEQQKLISLSFNEVTNTERVLGMFWEVSMDAFTFSLKFSKLTEDLLTGKRRPTKREVLRTLMTIFDPLGLLSFFLVYVKILLQEIWSSPVGWDDVLTDVQFAKWITWIELLPQIEQLRIPRLYSSKMFPGQLKSIELHVFVDASELAFAAVAYFRVEDENGIECVLIGSKTRVAPRKPLSIPRLELQGAVLGSRYINYLAKTHTIPISRRCLWTDSQVVLRWLRSEARIYRQFVAFRIGEILELTDIDEWRWVATKDNVADDATKWTRKPNMSPDSRWFKGPEFLKEYTDEGKDDWLHHEVNMPQEELRLQCSHAEAIAPVVPEPKRFSIWERMHRAQAYVIKMVRNLPIIVRIPSNTPLTPNELKTAELSLFRRAQFDVYGEELAILNWNKDHPNETKKLIDQSSSILQCAPYIDDSGILRVHGRIDAALGVSWDTKRPIILPRNHRITQLLIDSYHRKFHHGYHETVINELKQRFYIPRVRVALKSVVTKCQFCKNKRASPVIPLMADLPSARLCSYSRTFTNIGMDYFGPLWVTQGRSHVKRWGVLFTCLTTRAIRLEIAHTLNTNSCIMVLRNFMARAGQPSKIFSDNGTNLHGSDNELNEEFAKMNPTIMEQTFNTSETKWYFNPPTAAHMGGCFERLIRSVKVSLYHVLNTKFPTDEILRNVLMECESIVNCRPLTFVPIDHSEAEALTPNHFILGSSGRLPTPCVLDPDPKFLKQNWQMGQSMANNFWKRWTMEYLPTITRRTKWFHEVKPIEVGDIVFVVDPKLPRNSWPRGIITEVYRGNNDQVRSALVTTANGIYHRPVAKLAVLDVRDQHTDDEVQGDRLQD